MGFYLRMSSCVASVDCVCVMSLSSVIISEGVVSAGVLPESQCQLLLPKAIRIQTGRVNECTGRLTRSTPGPVKEP